MSFATTFRFLPFSPSLHTRWMFALPKKERKKQNRSPYSNKFMGKTTCTFGHTQKKENVMGENMPGPGKRKGTQNRFPKFDEGGRGGKVS